MKPTPLSILESHKLGTRESYLLETVIAEALLHVQKELDHPPGVHFTDREKTRFAAALLLCLQYIPKHELQTLVPEKED